ncbi:hypothetical protein ACFLVX_01610 [Chloroflexota bacterium]
MLGQAKQALNDYVVFIANLNAFVSASRSVTLVMQKELKSVRGFKDWYDKKKHEMSRDPDFKFFNTLRVDTVHVRPFNMPSTYTTRFQGGFTASGGKTMEIPLGIVDDRGNIVTNDQESVLIDGKPFHGVKRSTVRNYFFIDKPGEDALNRCEKYLQKLGNIVVECRRMFSPGQ